MADKIESTKSLSETYYEEVEALKAQGVSNADAVRQTAEKHGKNENAVRGGIHQYKSRHVNGNGNGNGSGPRTGRRRGGSTLTVDGLMSSARQSLELALELVDREVDEAKARLDAAQDQYDEVTASVKDRKADIETRLKALQ